MRQTERENEHPTRAARKAHPVDIRTRPSPGQLSTLFERADRRASACRNLGRKTSRSDRHRTYTFEWEGA